MSEDRGKSIQSEGDEAERLVTLGRITGLHGVQGWVKVFSDTSPRDNILKYSPWYLLKDGRLQERKLEKGRPHGKTIVAKLNDCNDREDARELMGSDIAVYRSQLEDTLGRNEFYWTDLEGLAVVTKENLALGNIAYLFETGSNDVMVVRGEKERFIPFIRDQVVLQVDLEGKQVTVDWDPEF